ncbi:peptidoglycan editing factor PgeF [Rhodoferax sp.]|uniref:peptidoglycan editing factor PgeF n=1 Tax=Rhodoferax sp. TaxID=50421 RepID=UPI0025F3A091|nr:peptidoglycan editing factor PgeF [Rhodoferax sp.]
MPPGRAPEPASPEHGWLIPDWPAPAGVRSVFTTRQGGVSVGAYAGLNLGLHVADDAAAVAQNRQRLAQAVGGRPVFLNQVHGTKCIELDGRTPDGTEADACTTSHPGAVCTIMVADCLPVLLTTTGGGRVAAAHAGWRGLLGQGGTGVLEQTLESFCPLAPANKAGGATEIIAWLGPCIGPGAFEVGDEVRSAFVEALPQAQAFFQPLSAGKWLADLPGLARQRLQAAGVQRIYGNDGSPAWCTVSNPSRFFSHRRDRISGRMAACIWLE